MYGDLTKKSNVIAIWWYLLWHTCVINNWIFINFVIEHILIIYYEILRNFNCYGLVNNINQQSKNYNDNGCQSEI